MFSILLAILWQALSISARAEVQVTGEPDAIQVEAKEASVEEFLTALRKAYGLRTGHRRISAVPSRELMQDRFSRWSRACSCCKTMISLQKQQSMAPSSQSMARTRRPEATSIWCLRPLLHRLGLLRRL
jgi:hypothetical protein